MALHVRKGDLLSNQENLNTKAVKTAVPAKPMVVIRRPAFVDVGNKLRNEQNENVVKKKPVPAGYSQPPTGAIRKTAAATQKVVNQKVLVTKKVDKQPAIEKPGVKREESTILKQIAKFESHANRGEQAHSSKQLNNILDADTSDDPLHVSEYVQDIYRYLLSLEVKFKIDEKFLETHKTTNKMRSVLVNWMVDVHKNFNLLLETLHLSVAIVDRYLQINKKIGRETLQLVGTSAMIIAGKYEEIYVPDLSDFVYICDDTFSKRQILDMEVDILKKLNFNLGRPLSLHFLRRFNKIAKVNSDHHILGKYILELALIEYEFCHVKPSILAAAACCLSLSVLDNLADPAQAWTRPLVHYSSYKYPAIKVTIVKLACVLGRVESSKFQAIKKKYASSTFNKMSVNPKLKGTLIRKLIASSPLLTKQ